MKHIFWVLPLMLTVLYGCTVNIRNISSNVDPSESIVVGRIETVPVFWDYSLFEERSDTEDRIEIAGAGYGLTKATRLQNEGYVFKTIRPGVYMLRLRKVHEGEYVMDDILRIHVSEGSLVYFGTVKVVVDEIIVDPSQLQANTPKRGPIMVKYHFVAIDEEATLQHFEKQYPEAYAAFRNRIVRIQGEAPPKEYIFLPGVPPFAGRHAPLTLTAREVPP